LPFLIDNHSYSYSIRVIMIVCVCAAVSESQIRAAFNEGVASLDELQAELGVALRCGRCAAVALEMLSAHQDSTIAAGTVRELQRLRAGATHANIA
jgi:bacterioferritin-associated ferredoxin